MILPSLSLQEPSPSNTFYGKEADRRSGKKKKKLNGPLPESHSHPSKIDILSQTLR